MKMEDLAQNKIPISMSWIIHADGKVEPEVHISIDELIDFDGPVDEYIKDFKKRYLRFLRKGEFLKKALATGNSKKIYNISKMLYDFHYHKDNAFVIQNYSQAYAKDLNISTRYIRNCFDFARLFSYYDVSEIVPFGFYQALIDKSAALEQLKLLKKEKQFLKTTAIQGKLPSRDEYRDRLRGIISK